MSTPRNPKIVLAVGAIIQKDKKILMVRKRKGMIHEGLWTLPGGKVKPREKLKEALKREIKEEINLDITSTKFTFFFEYFQQNIHLILFIFKCKVKGKLKSSSDIDTFRWINHNEIMKLPLRPPLKMLFEKNNFLA